MYACLYDMVHVCIVLCSRMHEYMEDIVCMYVTVFKNPLYRASIANRKYSCQCKKIDSLSNQVLVTFCLMRDG